MTKKIHTIQSSDKVEFDKQVNELLELGCELMDGGYQVINNDDGVVYSQVVVFKDNLKVEFYENGRLKSICPSDKRNGLIIGWYENGQKGEVKNYKDGKLNGLCTEWYENGQKKVEGTWKDGKEDGLNTFWYENGQKKEERTYKDGEKDGLSTSWYDNGQKLAIRTYKDGNLRFSTWWYENEQMKSKGTYKDGEKISGKGWNEDGSPK